ncbi:phenylacetate--CoA ligase family protein [Pseudonocardia sp. NPDC049154]|uniref:phenylacetate--CoA ligase family protein n=1 Tax=Pseudonocardia sp. NPDC049154 TaxID=3155501 RepID=UPI0033DDBC85
MTDDLRDRRYLEPDIETASRAELEALQERRVLELIPLAWENSAFYRKLWSAAGVDPSAIRSLADFRRLVPTFGKADVQAYRARTGDPYGGLLLVPPDELTSVTSTSGTTSDPEPIPEIWSTAPPLPVISARDLWEVGVRPGDRVVVPVGTFRGHYGDAFQAMGLVPIYADMWIGKGAELLRVLETLKPTYISLLMPTIMELEKLEATHDVRGALSSLKGAAFAGQPLGAVLSRKVREEWGVELFTYASAADTGTAWECREHDGYHLWEDTVMPELLDPHADTTVADGLVGELVATDLDNAAAPLIRYRSGDLVRLTTATCGCGRTHARQWIVGRKGDEMTIDGRTVVLSDVWAAVEAVPEAADGMFQVIRYADTMSTLRLRVGYAPDRTSDLDELAQRVRASVATRVGVQPDLELVTTATLLERSSSVAKFPRVVKA